MTSLVTAIKVVSVIVIFFEVCTNVGFLAAINDLSEITTQVDKFVGFGVMGLIVPSFARILSALHARSYAATRTDRTPVNREETTRFMRAVTFVSIFSTIVVICL